MMRDQTQTIAQQFVPDGPGTTGSAGVPPAVQGPYIDDHVAMLTPDGETWTAHYYHTDEMFNTLALSDDDSEVAERADFDPYGTVVLKDGTGTPISTSAIGNPFLRQGIIRDWETHNDDNRHRWYAPTLGRWSQRDPLFTNGHGTNGSSGLAAGSSNLSHIVPLGTGRGGYQRSQYCIILEHEVDSPQRATAGAGPGLSTPNDGCRPRTTGCPRRATGNTPQHVEKINYYQFARSGPTIYVDPSGLVATRAGCQDEFDDCMQDAENDHVNCIARRTRDCRGICVTLGPVWSPQFMCCYGACVISVRLACYTVFVIDERNCAREHCQCTGGEDC
jgi:RHS repeat-associated protein